MAGKIEQQTVSINQQLSFLMSNGKWRNCQRKQYSVYAIVPPAGYVFANKLEQPEQFRYIRERFKTFIVSMDKITQADMQALGNNCYKTDGKSVVICGTRGELWMSKAEQFVKSYTKPDGSPADKIPTQWTEFSRAAESAPSAKGVQIPLKYLGVYQGKYGERKMNDTMSTGHYSGDILVVSLDGSTISTVNNEVFAMTFNQQVGGWAQSGCITPVDKIKPLTIDEVKRHYCFGGTGSKEVNADNSKAKISVKYVCKSGNSIKGYILSDGKTDKPCSKEQLITFIKGGKIVNAKVQVYNGTDIIRLQEGTYEIKDVGGNNNVTKPVEKPAEEVKLTITKVFKSGRSATKYVVTGSDGSSTAYERGSAELLNLISEKKIINAAVQVYQGRNIVRLKDNTYEVVEVAPEETKPVVEKPVVNEEEPKKRYKVLKVFRKGRKMVRAELFDYEANSSHEFYSPDKVMQLLKDKQIENGFVQTYEGRDIPRFKDGTYEIVQLNEEQPEEAPAETEKARKEDGHTKLARQVLDKFKLPAVNDDGLQFTVATAKAIGEMLLCVAAKRYSTEKSVIEQTKCNKDGVMICDEEHSNDEGSVSLMFYPVKEDNPYILTVKAMMAAKQLGQTGESSIVTVELFRYTPKKGQSIADCTEGEAKEITRVTVFGQGSDNVKAFASIAKEVDKIMKDKLVK